MKTGARRARVTAILALALFSAAACAPRSDAAMGTIDESMQFELPDLQGKLVRLDETLKANKAVLINFWATWCPPCREEIPDLIELQKEYGGRGFTILGVDVDESKKKVASFVQKTGINYPILLDDGSVVAERYGVVGIPTSVLILSDGTVVNQYHSASAMLKEDVRRSVE